MALEHLHSVNVVYRDLKMENILLTNSGHIIITDLGMSKKFNPGERSFSIVGTPEFMVAHGAHCNPQSPEIISRRGHEMETDFWSLGILAYQIMVGIVPFNGNSVNVRQSSPLCRSPSSVTSSSVPWCCRPSSPRRPATSSTPSSQKDPTQRLGRSLAGVSL